MAVVNPNYVRILAVQNLVWVAKLSPNVSAKISGLRHPDAGMLFSSEQLDPHASPGTGYTLPYCATVINHPFNKREPLPPPRCHVLPCNTRVRYLYHASFKPILTNLSSTPILDQYSLSISASQSWAVLGIQLSIKVYGVVGIMH